MGPNMEEVTTCIASFRISIKFQIQIHARLQVLSEMSYTIYALDEKVTVRVQCLGRQHSMYSY